MDHDLADAGYRLVSRIDRDRAVRFRAAVRRTHATAGRRALSFTAASGMKARLRTAPGTIDVTEQAPSLEWQARQLLSAAAVRTRAQQLLRHGVEGRLEHFAVDLGRLEHCADEVVATI